jgi:hypothetical protein
MDVELWIGRILLAALFGICVFGTLAAENGFVLATLG